MMLGKLDANVTGNARSPATRKSEASRCAHRTAKANRVLSKVEANAFVQISGLMAMNAKAAGTPAPTTQMLPVVSPEYEGQREYEARARQTPWSTAINQHSYRRGKTTASGDHGRPS